MGCQCAKPQEQTNLNLETAPPKSDEHVNVQVKGESVNISKVENSKVDISKNGKKKKKVTKKKSNK